MTRKRSSARAALLALASGALAAMGCNAGGSGGESGDAPGGSERVGAGAYIVELASPVTYSPDADMEWKSFYGISWQGTAEGNLRYAHNMGYRYVFYQDGAGDSPYASEFQFFFDGPLAFAMVEHAGWSVWGLEPDEYGSYSAETKAFLDEYAAWKSSTEPAPSAFAPGCRFTEDRYMLNFDLQRDSVRADVVSFCVQRVKDIQARHPSIRFKGFAFDAPEVTGEFHAWENGAARGVDLTYWTGADSCACTRSHEIDTYSNAMARFFLELRAAAKELNGSARTIVEPYWIHDAWIGLIEEHVSDASVQTSLVADTLASQEGGMAAGGEFFEDERIFRLGLTRENVGCSTPDVHDEPSNRLLAAQAALNHSWFNWFGRFGGTGDGYDYESIDEVPSWLKLIRVVANWDNLSGATERSWDGTVYRSSNSYMDGHVIATRNPYTGKLFVVFLDDTGRVTLKPGERVESVKRADAFFGEAADGGGDLTTTTDGDGRTVLEVR